MAPSWRAKAITGVALFLEGCSLYLIISVASHLAKFEALQMPFWLVLLALTWGYGLSSWALTLRVTPVMRGLTGLALGVPSLLVLTAWNAGHALLPFGLLTSGGMGGVGLFAGSMIFLLVIWWRGAEISREEVTLDAVRSAFQIGMVVLLTAALIDAVMEASIVSGFLALGFFAVGLPGMALARFFDEGGEERRMPAQWLWPIAACVGVVLALGLLVSGLGLGGLDDVTRAVVRTVGAVGYRILEPLLLVIGYLAGGLVSIGNWFSGILGGGDLEGLLEAQRRLDEFHQSLREAEGQEGGGVLFTAMKWAAAVIGVTVAAGVVYALFRARRRTGRSAEVVESRESLFSLKRAGDDLGDALGGLFSGLRPGRSRSRNPRSPRDYYHALLELAARAGRPREQWETPKEHQRGLMGILPADPVARIVDDFQAAHYGAAPMDSSQSERLEADRLAIEKFLRERETES